MDVNVPVNLPAYVVPDGMARSVFENKYSRRKADGTMQSYEERMREVVLGNFMLDPAWLPEMETNSAAHADWSEKQVALFNDFQNTTALAVAGIMPTAGRHIQHGDTDQPGKIMELHTNCSTAAFSFMLMRLLLRGSGVGRDYSAETCRVNWDNMPDVRLVLDESHPDFHKTGMYGWVESLRDARHKYDSSSENTRWFVVEDSREGWSKVVEILETAAWQEKHKNKLFVFDFSQVRPEGAPIMGLQGRPASGPLAFMKAVNQVASVKGVGMKPWKQALFIDHYIASAIAWGGARRAARMATKNWRDRDVIEFIDIKRGGFLWSANNSILADKEFWEAAREPRPSHGRRVFEAIVGAAYWDASGEPGIINVDMLNLNTNGMDKITGATLINENVYTDLHHKTKEMIDNVLAHVKQVSYPFITNPCFAADTLIVTDKGAFPIKDLVGKEVNVWDGTNWRTVNNFRVTGTDQPMLKITLTSGDVLRVTPAHTMYLADNTKLTAADLVPGSVLLTAPHIAETPFTVASVDTDGIDAEVYCCTVYGTHKITTAIGITTGQCGEIVLSNYGGYCVIGDVNLARVTHMKQALDAVSLMSKFLVRVNRMRCEYAAEVERTNRIGVSLTGIHEFAWNLYGLTFWDLIGYYDVMGTPAAVQHKAHLFWWGLHHMQREAENSATVTADRFGMVSPHTVTTIKPSGTVSKVMNVTEGAHLPALKHYLRWVQFKIGDADIDTLTARGYPFKDISHRYSGHVAIGFPTKQPIVDLMGDKVVTADETTPEQNFKWLRLLEHFWLGENGRNNQVSYTLKYDSKTTSYQDFMDMILEWQPQVRCCSVMPQSDWRESERIYGYVPEQPITKDEYEAYMAVINPVAKEAYDDEQLMCEGGVCPIEMDINR